jgi:amidase
VDQIWKWSALQIRRAVANRDVSPVEVAEACNARIDEVDGTIRAFVNHDPGFSVDAARLVEARLRRGAELPLGGVPYGIKDTTDTAGVVTTYGSAAFADHVPDQDAAVVARLKRGGGLFTGKTNAPEFGSRATTAFGLHPATVNPWDTRLTPGGSSGGSAAAVASGMVPVAEGSDGGGSIRIPSSCSGVVGLKPSRGRITNAPLSAVWGGLVTHGPLGRTVRDVALMLDVMQGPGTGDFAWVSPPEESFLSAADRPFCRFRIAKLTESDKPIDPLIVDAVDRTAESLEELGHIVESAGPDLTGLGPTFRTLVESAFAADPPPGLGYSDPYCRWCYERGAKISAVEYVRAMDTMQMRSRKIIGFFGDWDLLLTPTLTMLPQPVDEFLADTETVAEVDLSFIPFTYPFNITGQPAISLPLGETPDGIPIGVQLVAAPTAEATLIHVAAQLEEAMPWGDRWPDL